MKKLFTLIFFTLLIFFSINLFAEKYAVYFTDKDNTPYSIENPEAFLSQRALDRRARHGIAINLQDLPVDPQYVSTLKSMGATVPFTSKWLNCALVSCSPTVKTQIEQLPFVSQVIYAGPGNYGGKSGEGSLISKFAHKLEKEENFTPAIFDDISRDYSYGYGFTQINQLNGIPVHEQGYTGEGVLIAVLDAGFNNVKTLPVFSNLFSEGRLVFELDVVVPNGNIYQNTHSHGTNVLSCMSAYTNGSFVGTAPKAMYALIRTEEDPGEYLIECYNWVVGAEAADSIGADIINTSLGYTKFDDPSMNYTYAQMDGETPVASFAAKTAIEKGVFVTASAGNNGDDYSWPWMGSPGDATYAGTIGAVDDDGYIAYFSSIGPNGAGVPKPNTLALGWEATVYSTSGNINYSYGTSFSSPITCGMYACLIQANPKIHPKMLRDIVDETGDRYPNHDNTYGYGIPDFAAALETVLSLPLESECNIYAVHFKDKNNTPYSIDNPLAYLSQRAIDRRSKYGIAVTEDDLPVDPDYVEKVNKICASVSATSRWSNSVLVCADDEMINAINKLDFVDKVVYVKPAEEKCLKYDIHPKWKNEEVTIAQSAKNDYDYGYAYDQINQLNGIPVHQQGHTGEGVIIAVLDGGFQNADKVNGLAHLFESGRIVLERNIVEPQRSLYDEDISSHGTLVLSCMGGILEGNYVGTAPQASYALIVTEDTPTEYLIEEYFWMMGAEVADSLGADIINSSLGYSVFDDPEMNHLYKEMDGNTAISSIAAKMAVERGIFVTVSAGNSNGDDFPWVGSPADAPKALTLGAVNLNGEIAGFSSIGPNGAGDPKPDVVACGWNAYALAPDNTIVIASGTSISSPITCGMVACIIGADPQRTPAEILKAVQTSANRYPEHDIQYGYGIPDFWKVLYPLGISSFDHKTGSKLTYYPNPVNDKLYLSNDDQIIKTVEFYDITGRLIKTVSANAHQISIDVKEMNRGMLFVKVVYDNDASEVVRCVVVR